MVTRTVTTYGRMPTLTRYSRRAGVRNTEKGFVLQKVRRVSNLVHFAMRNIHSWNRVNILLTEICLLNLFGSILFSIQVHLDLKICTKCV